MDNSKREFSTIREIFEIYFPKHYIQSLEYLDQSNIDIGTQLADELLKEFEEQIDKAIKEIN